MLQNKIKYETLLSVLILGFFFSFILKFVILGHYLKFGYPYENFFWHHHERFKDFFAIFNVNITNDPYVNLPGRENHAYFPLAYHILKPLSFFNNFEKKLLPFIVFVSFCSIIIFSCAYYFIKKISFVETFLKKISLIILVIFLSYPFLYCIDRGNLDLLLLCLFFLAIIGLVNQKEFIFIFFITLCSLIKPFFIFYLILILKINEKKSVKLFFFSLFIFFIFFILLIIPFEGKLTDNIITLKNNYNWVINLAEKPDPWRRNLSILDPIKLFFNYNFTTSYYDLYQPKKINAIYTIVSFFFLIVSFALIILSDKKIMWKNITILTCCQILFRTISGNYSLVYFIPCIFLFMTSEDKLKKSKIYTYSVLFGCTLIPKDYYYFERFNFEIDIGVILNPFILFVLLLLLLYDHFKTLSLKKFFKIK